MGYVDRIASVLVRKMCLLFWFFLISCIAISATGVFVLLKRARDKGQGNNPFTPATQYDWSVVGQIPWVQQDMVNSAHEQADAYQEDRGIAAGVLDATVPLQSENMGIYYSMSILYMANDGDTSVFTPAKIQEMCETENVILNSTDYGKVCHNSLASGYPRTEDALGNCTLPRFSAASLYYVQFDDSVPTIDVIRANKQAMATQAAIISSSLSSSSNWAAAASAAQTAAATATTANPGGALSQSYSSKEATLATAVATLPGLSGSALTLKLDTIKDLLADLDGILDTWAGASTAKLDTAVLSKGLPLYGLPANAPVLSQPADRITVAGSHARDCRLLDATYVAARTAQLFDIAHASDSGLSTVGFYLQVDAMDANRTLATRSQVSFGSPRLAPYESDEAFEEWSLLLEAKFWAEFGMEAGCLSKEAEFGCPYSAYRTPAATDALEVKFITSYWASYEFPRTVNSDFLMVIASMLFVYSYICVHTGSFALGCFAILQIVLSVPLSLFFYVVIFQIPYFAQVHNLAIFIILGVGADDIFVFMDAWRQSSTMPEMKTLVDRMRHTYARTSFTVLNTSLTTAIAFFSTAAAPIMPIASFGVFAAVMIILNWVLVCTWWPTVVLIWEVYFCKSHGVGCCFSCDSCCYTPCKIADGSTHPATDPAAARHSIRASDDVHSLTKKAAPLPDGGLANKMKLGFSERVFHDYYAPLLTWHVGPSKLFKPVSLILVLGFGGLGFYLVAEAVTLSTPEEEPSWFPGNHMFTGLSDYIRDTYLSGDDDAYIPGSIYFGLQDIDAPDYTKWLPGENRGSVIYDPTFDLSDPQAQSSFLQLCADLRVEACNEPSVCTRPPQTLASLDSVDCFLEAFRAYSGGTLPTGSAFHTGIQAWLDVPGAAGGSDYKSDVGIVGGFVKFARIPFVYTALDGIPVSKERTLYDRCTRFLAEKFFPTAPPTLSSAFFFAGRIFPWMTTSESLVTVVLNGFAIIFPCAFCILFVSSGSLLVAAYATLTVALITASLLGGSKLAFGFSLGIGEAIAGNIVIGLSIDYTLHLSHAYMDNDSTSREAKVTHAATIMGVTVVGGAITTFVSALFMLACQLTFFGSMCTLIGGTIMFSLTYSLFFFMPLMALAGPTGESKPLFVRIAELVQPSAKQKVATSKDDTISTASSEAAETAA